MLLQGMCTGFSKKFWLRNEISRILARFIYHRGIFLVVGIGPWLHGVLKIMKTFCKVSRIHGITQSKHTLEGFL